MSFVLFRFVAKSFARIVIPLRTDTKFIFLFPTCSSPFVG